MSVTVWGAIQLNNTEYTEKYLIKLAFKIIIIAAENNIGINLGGRIQPWISELYKKHELSSNSIPFEIVNHSLNPNVGALFIGEGNEIYGESWGESLESRMTRIHKFLNRVISLRSIKKINFYVDSGYDEEFAMEIKASDFKSKILELFQKNDNMTPSITCIIKQ